jgi:hypothetical protein
LDGRGCCKIRFWWGAAGLVKEFNVGGAYMEKMTEQNLINALFNQFGVV